jgi:hypothetical protein
MWQVEAVFGTDSPAAGLTRYTSLNLLSVTKHGTLEARRFHGCLDGDAITHWAHFVVAFVESFHGQPAEAALLAMPLRQALKQLQQEQERATPVALMARMGRLLDPATAQVLMADACSQTLQHA